MTASGTSEPYVFLSYTSTDRPRALALADALETAGFTVWVDRRDIAGGSSWDTAIVDAISHCAVFALACTPASLASPNVQQEVRVAWEEQRPLLPLLLEQTPIPRELRYPLAGRQWVELQDRAEEAWLPDVLRALAGLGVVPSSAPTTPVPAPPHPASPPTTLPATLTRFLGREQELDDLAQLLATNRLVTLTGPGGTGKTRLAISAASAQAAAFPDGVFFIDLAPFADPTLVPSAVAQTLGIQGLPEMSARDSVVRFVRDKRLLLLLDNYEHLLAAAEFAGALLQAGPAVTLLVTSRAPLRVNGEREYAVSPLLVPEARSRSAAELRHNPAVQLFVLRAQAVRADFVLTAENAATVATICIRLDGLPLAIELAAARVRALPPAGLLARLEQRLPLLTGGRRDMPARQQTLRDAIAWSYDLLEPSEQRLFRRLGVVAGGCTLELAEAVCTAEGNLGIDVLNGINSLVEKSLLREGDGQAGEPRYRMLETIREFALRELEASGEAETVRRQLAVQVLQFAEQAAAATNWALLDIELDNARAVLGWCVEREELAVGVRLYWALGLYLYSRGHGNEEQEWRRRFLALPAAVLPSIARARLLTQASRELLTVAEQEKAAGEFEEAIGLSRQLGDTPCLARALSSLALLRLGQGRFDAVVPPAEEALTLALGDGNAQLSAMMQLYLITAAVARGNLATAEALVAAMREREDTTRSADALQGEAVLAEANGDVARARVLWEEVVRKTGAELGEQSPLRLMRLGLLARVMLRQGDTRAAVASCAASLAGQRSVGPSRFLPLVLTMLAQAAEWCGRLGASARLLSAVAVQRRQYAAGQFGLAAEHQAASERVLAALGPAAFAEAWAAGEALSADESIEFGLEVVAQLQQLLATDSEAPGEGTRDASAGPLAIDGTAMS
jgi:non-specific serine/threonine protein kinase